MQEEKPAFQDSMLLLDDTLEIPEESTDGQQAGESMEYDAFQADSMEYNPSSQESHSDIIGDYYPRLSNCLSYI